MAQLPDIFNSHRVESEAVHGDHREATAKTSPEGEPE